MTTERQDVPDRRSSLRLWVALQILMAATACSVLFAYVRPGWMDEFLSYEVTDPHRSATALYLRFWSQDQHAPTYYALLWSWRRIFAIGRDLMGMRLLSLSLSFLLAVFTAFAGRLLTGRATLLALLVASSPTFLYYSGESRSYFLSYFGGALTGLFFLASLASGNVARRRILWLATGVLGAALCTVHLVSLLICGACLATLAGAALARRDAHLGGAALAIGLGVLSPVLAWTLVGSAGARGALNSFWITRWQVLHAALWLPAFLGLPVLLGAASLAKGHVRRELSRRGRLAAVGWALTAAVVVIVVAFGVSLLKPFIVLRYFSSLAGFMAPVAAFALEPFADRLPRPARPFWAAGALAAGWVALLSIPDEAGDWRRPGAFVRALPQCRTAAIPVAILTEVPDAGALTSWSPMFGWYAGGDGRFTPATPSVLAAVRSQSCPVRLWAADLQERYLGTAVRSAFDQVCRAEPDARVLRFRHGVLVTSRGVTAAWGGREETCPDLLRRLGPR